MQFNYLILFLFSFFKIVLTSKDILENPGTYSTKVQINRITIIGLKHSLEKVSENGKTFEFESQKENILVIKPKDLVISSNFEIQFSYQK